MFYPYHRNFLKKMNAKSMRELKRLAEHHTRKDDINMLQRGQFGQPDCATKRKKSAYRTFLQPNIRPMKIRIGNKNQATICVNGEDTADKAQLTSVQDTELSLTKARITKTTDPRAQKLPI